MFSFIYESLDTLYIYKWNVIGIWYITARHKVRINSRDTVYQFSFTVKVNDMRLFQQMCFIWLHRVRMNIVTNFDFSVVELSLFINWNALSASYHAKQELVKVETTINTFACKVRISYLRMCWQQIHQQFAKFITRKLLSTINLNYICETVVIFFTLKCTKLNFMYMKIMSLIYMFTMWGPAPLLPLTNNHYMVASPMSPRLL